MSLANDGGGSDATSSRRKGDDSSEPYRRREVLLYRSLGPRNDGLMRAAPAGSCPDLCNLCNLWFLLPSCLPASRRCDRSHLFAGRGLLQGASPEA